MSSFNEKGKMSKFYSPGTQKGGDHTICYCDSLDRQIFEDIQ